MVGVMHVLDVSVEPVVFVRRVRHLSQTTVRLRHAVLAVDHVAVPVLRLVFVVAGVRVFHAVFVLVMRRGLWKTYKRVSVGHRTPPPPASHLSKL